MLTRIRSITQVGSLTGLKLSPSLISSAIETTTMKKSIIFKDVRTKKNIEK